jgi:hypothetical protein
MSASGMRDASNAAAPSALCLRMGMLLPAVMPADCWTTVCACGVYPQI